MEVALLDGDRVGLRDAKAPDRLPIVFASGDWDLFLADVQSGHYQDI